MTREWSQAQATIGHLTVHYSGSAADMNTVALRLRVERLLGTVDLHPGSLPSGAVLVVRKLQGLASLSLSALSQTSQSAWSERLHDRVTTLSTTAVRPALGAVSSDATSVLFTDPAEMLACLTRDLMAGRAWQQWYWQQLLRGVPHAPGPALATLWSEQASFVPAALGYMKIEEAQAAVALLSPAEVSRVTSALHMSFDLPSMVLATSKPGTLSTEGRSDASPHVLSTEELPGRSPLLPPWHPWLPSASLLALTPHAQYLLGLGLTLYHAPALARSTKFAVSVASWLRTERALPLAPSESTRKEGQVLNQSNPELKSTKTPSSIQEQTDPDLQKSPVANEVVFGVSKPLPSDGVPTELGGILYLVNLLTWLNLPGGWDEDGTFAEHLSGWATVEALARGLLGSIHDRYIDDPIWSILALLDGREPGTLVGANFPQQSSFHLPAKWLRRYGPAEPAWGAMVDGERLLIFDEVGGYLVADVPLLGRLPEEVLVIEVETYRKDGFSPAGHSTTLTPTQADKSAVGAINRAPTQADALNWWLGRVLGFVRYLLARALGEPSLDPGRLAEMLLCKHGQLLAGRTHIDLNMSMDEISLLIRRAGLDRDPSWVPDLGRTVLFHFD